MRSSQRKRRLAPAETRPTKVETVRGFKLPFLLYHLAYRPQGTDHQRIVKLDRENEVAPPPKVAPSVGRVRVFYHLRLNPPENSYYIWKPFCDVHTGNADSTSGTEALAEGRCSKDK